MMIRPSATSTKRNIIILTVFSIAMGLLEAIVVVYLRQIYYPEGFAFPLKSITVEGLSIELLREASTIIMLVSVSLISGKSFYDIFSYFLLCFGIWDIFYYIWLKVLLNWPSSLFTWDVLFLIPVVWVGPVLAPIICALTMVILAGSILYFQHKGIAAEIELREWILMSLGAFAIFLTFIWDYSKIIIQGGFLSRLSSVGSDPQFQKIVGEYIPASYNWYVFIAGEIFMLGSLVLYWRRRGLNRKRLVMG